MALSLCVFVCVCVCVCVSIFVYVVFKVFSKKKPNWHRHSQICGTVLPLSTDAADSDCPGQADGSQSWQFCHVIWGWPKTSCRPQTDTVPGFFSRPAPPFPYEHNFRAFLCTDQLQRTFCSLLCGGKHLPKMEESHTHLYYPRTGIFLPCPFVSLKENNFRPG